jgi:hypothetical protein
VAFYTWHIAAAKCLHHVTPLPPPAVQYQPSGWVTHDLAGERLGKGQPVLIEGRLQQDLWEDKETGQKRSKLKVVGESMQILSGISGGDDDDK